MFDLRLPLGLQTEAEETTTSSPAAKASSAAATTTTSDTSSSDYLLRRQMLKPDHSMHRRLTLVEMPPEDSDKVWTYVGYPFPPAAYQRAVCSCVTPLHSECNIKHGQRRCGRTQTRPGGGPVGWLAGGRQQCGGPPTCRRTLHTWVT